MARTQMPRINALYNSVCIIYGIFINCMGADTDMAFFHGMGHDIIQ